MVKINKKEYVYIFKMGILMNRHESKCSTGGKPVQVCLFGTCRERMPRSLLKWNCYRWNEGL